MRTETVGTAGILPRPGTSSESARHSLPWLVGLFVVLLLLVGAAAAILDGLRGPQVPHGFWWWWKQAMLVLAGQSPHEEAFDDSLSTSLVQLFS